MMVLLNRIKTVNRTSYIVVKKLWHVVWAKSKMFIKNKGTR